MVGIEDVWPDDPSERVRLTVESLQSPFTISDVTDRAGVSRDTAHDEIFRLADEGLVTRHGDNEWRVNTDRLDSDGLFPG